MHRFVNCSTCELDEGNLLIRNVTLPEGTYSAVYLGSGGICAVVDSPDSDPQVLYSALRSLLDSVRVALFCGSFKRYDPYQRIWVDLPGSTEARDAEIWDYLLQKPCVNSPDKIMLMRDKLVYADAHTRGHYCDNGVLYLLHGEHFQPVSDLDPDRQFRVTLWGGLLGLHRFLMGKYFSGILYFFTCGIFLLGWLLDIFQLLTGVQRDRQKALILPPEDRRKAWICILPCLAAGTVFLFFYLQIVSFVLDVGTNIAVSDLFLEKLLKLSGQ